ncbi:hypothetical protein, partial [Chromobacterium haemolyticum]|uniref:hypothetical protein n=1 Tax=Chromobacterium haemolyticum TaxID=394935 RepID=UPI0015F2D063
PACGRLACGAGWLTAVFSESLTQPANKAAAITERLSARTLLSEAVFIMTLSKTLIMSHQ